MFPPLNHILSEKVRFKIRIWQSLRTGPPFRSNLDRIIIDLTHFCDLSCTDCNRSCGKNQAPAEESISPEQIRRFIDESVRQGKQWKRIWLEGGEPTLHPRLDEILDMLLQYKTQHNRSCEILLCTNGHGEKARQVIDRLPMGVGVKNSRKSPGSGNDHFPFNIAPADLAEFSGADYSHSCYIHHMFGLGLTRFGYYPHPVCGGIDRIFGFDAGLKRLPESPFELTGQMRLLCRLCGHFREYHPISGDRGHPWGKKKHLFPKESQSSSWINAYSAYRRARPVLTLY